MLSIRHHHYVNGIDVSDYQGDFDWASWNGHIDFAMVKATEGPTTDYPHGLVDTQFANNWPGAKAIGLHRFAYHFFRADHDPAAQARHFIRTVREHGLDLVDNFVMDWELANPDMPVVDQAFAAWVFMREVNRLEPQHHCLVYTYPNFAEMGYCAKLSHWGLWIANYGVPAPSVPVPWDKWQFWQFAPGRNGTPDLDRFNGNEHGLEMFCTR